ncbi:signal peptidase I [Actinomadura atramentaria]|uniref:signal peptidase I n=1 Tax=Actinomadura atramentaria TaxID=1990 RepID=UPI000A049F50|nr:signal peptidase I [Actinomadura atramentaria]
MQSDVGDQQDGYSPEVSGTSDEKGSGNKESRPFWKELPILILVAVILALVVKVLAIQAFYIPSGSMENTLHIGDRVLVNKIVYRTRDVRRGEVIVFKGPPSWDSEGQMAPPKGPLQKTFRWIGGVIGFAPSGKDFIKRVIGIGGDHVKCCDTEGRVTVNGAPLNEQSYLFKDPVTHVQSKPSDESFDITVPPGRLWVMGDHRNMSADSRYHQGDSAGGTIPVGNVIGRAFVVIWPVGRIGNLPVPSTFEQSGLEGAALPGLPASPSTGYVEAVAGLAPESRRY